MSLFKRTLERLQENKRLADSGELNCIPFGFKRLEQHLPGIQRNRYYIVTANSGVGKTQITDSMFLYSPYNFLLGDKTGISLKIFYYSLEMDKESKITAGIGKYIYEKYGIVTDVNQLLSIGKNRLTDDLLTVVHDVGYYFERLEDILTIHDDQINPYGIYKELDEYAKANGKIVTKTINFIDNQTGEVKETKEVFDHYVPNNPKEYVIVITDHLAELSSEKGMDIKGTIEKHSDNMRLLRNRYGYTLVDVQQQSASQESKDGKLEPSLDGLGESKLTQRKANIVLGLFAPARHDLHNYNGYNILRLKDNFRSLRILKNRNGISNVVTGLYFNGAVNSFRELPKGVEMTEQIYQKLGV